MKIHEKLRKCREEKGYSQEAMAYSIVVSYGTYNNIENAKTNIKFSFLEKCAKVLDIPLLELLPAEYTHDIYEKLAELENRIEEKNEVIDSLLKKH